MFWLGLIGLAITIGGGIISAIGQSQKNAADQAKLESQLPVYDAEQTAIQAQLANIEAEKANAAKLAAINEAQIQRTSAFQQIGIAEAGAKAVGSTIATAAAGNIGGQSVLRRAQTIQAQTERQLTYVQAGAAGEMQKQEIGLSSTLGGLGVQRAGAQANLLQSQVNRTNVQSDIEFLQKYGWMSVAAVGLGAGAQAINQAQQIKWPAPSEAKTTDMTPSLATEDYTPAYDQWIGYF